MVFFDAHKPEPGAIRDTLEHLVEKAVERHDATKFIYILNQIDVTADENNLEDVVAAWQRALAQKGLTAGRFYRVFSLTACAHIENEEAAKRLIEWREQDMTDLEQRLGEVETHRVYRVADALRHHCRHIEEMVVPEIRERLDDWRHFVLAADTAVLTVYAVALILLLLFTGSWDGFDYIPASFVTTIMGSVILKSLVGVAVLGSMVFLHFVFRRFARQRYRPAADEHKLEGFDVESLDRAFIKSTGTLRSVLMRSPSGWHVFNRRRLSSVFYRAGVFIKKLNDTHIQPDGTWVDDDENESQKKEKTETATTETT